MKISEIQIAPVQKIEYNGPLAFASVVLADAIRLNSIAIYKNNSSIDKKYRLTYPIRKNTRQNLNYFFPLNKRIANDIENAVIKKFEQIISN